MDKLAFSFYTLNYGILKKQYIYELMNIKFTI